MRNSKSNRSIPLHSSQLSIVDLLITISISVSNPSASPSLISRDLHRAATTEPHVPHPGDWLFRIILSREQNGRAGQNVEDVRGEERKEE
jgi:hypothetical protein